MEIGIRYVRAKRKTLGSRRDGFLSFISTLLILEVTIFLATFRNKLAIFRCK